MEINFTRLRHIVAVASTASFSRAAEEEGITQPALSRSIQAFEQQHGVRVFDRGRGGVSLTPAGTLVVEQARSILASTSELERSLRLYGKGEAGRVGLGFGPLMGSLLVPNLGASFLDSRPNLQITVMIRPTDQLLDRLMDGTIELIVGNNWQLADAPGVDVEEVIDLALSPVARSGHPLAGRKGLSMADVDAYPWASAVELPRSGETSGGGLVCDNYHILREVAAASDCVWLTSTPFIEEDLRAGRLVRLDVADLPSSRTRICLVWRRSRTRSPAALAVAEHVRRMLRAMAD